MPHLTNPNILYISICPLSDICHIALHVSQVQSNYHIHSMIAVDSGFQADPPLTTEFLGWSYGLGARERQCCLFFGNDARFTGLARQHVAVLKLLYTFAYQLGGGIVR